MTSGVRSSSRLALCAGLLCLIAVSGCDRDAGDAARPVAEPLAEAGPPTPQQVVAYTTAEDAVLTALQRSHAAAARPSAAALRERKSGDVPAEVREQAEIVTVVFGANNHGEREDCGCKSNPLGGLTRRDTLVDLAGATDDAAARADGGAWWGAEAATDRVIHVDAGDLFFKTATLSKTSEPIQQGAKRDARAVAEALAATGPDAVNVGELDLALGLDTLLELREATGLPMISANLRAADGGEPLPGHRVVERDGAKVAVVGLTKDAPRLPNYYAERGAEVVPAEAAYLAELEELPDDVDLVVLLSNLGVQETRGLVESLRQKGARVDAAVVSNSNRLTRRPEWAAGVPIVEPMSRGKYLGRMDLYLQGEGTPAWTNAAVDPAEALRDYRRAWSNYVANRKQLNDLDRQIAGEEPAEASAREFARKRREMARKRLEVTSEGVAQAHAALRGALSPAESTGDDWLAVRVVPVKLAIPEDPAVRRVLDRAAKGSR